ncbi:NAD-dependent epimerase/dehydratase family protein [Nonomuraea sp. MG754425]|uniref:NAD(P)-dependent oxidoreductase n=1 Tax=Nonomuraea sp. MG754425 TaxID=2570319 RepID=UPI001F1E4D6C|nr:NAD(P)H-binding protein [Nonomuraea sp. MG754425]MCF6473166.1 NAD-dependent epimerase/dehydratase family protein [Nonomuraea sp. MG754425]
MRLFVFGASGGTGAHLLAQALEAGHRVTAVARTPRSLSGHPHLTALRGDVLEPGEWRQALAGHDAVLSCLGSAHRRPTTVYSQGMAAIVAAMQDCEVRRLACVTSASLDLSPAAPLGQRLLIGRVIRPLYRHMYADMAEMERIITASDLDWTVVRPPRLTDAPFTGRYLTTVNEHLPRTRSLPRADLAHYLLHHLDDRATWRAWIEISRR